MTRKDFVLIAEAIRVAAQGESYDLITHEAIAESIADALARTNSRFDRQRFLKACGVQS